MLLSVPRAHLGNQTTFTHYVSFGSSWLWDIFQTHLVFDDSFEKYCCCSVAKSCLTLCNPMNRSTPSLPALHCLLSLLKFISTESVKTSNHLILCHSLLLLPSIFPSIRVFSNESALRIRRPKYWSFSFSISPSNDYSRLISFRIYWFDLLTVQGTLKSLLQHHSSKASIFWHPAFFMAQLSHLYMTIGKTIVLTIQTFVSKVTSLLFNMLSLLCSSKERTSFNFVATVILEPKKMKAITFFSFSLSICHEVMGPDVIILVFWMLSFMSAFSLFSFTFIKRFASSSLLSAINVVESAYLRLLIFLQAILIPACAFHSALHLVFDDSFEKHYKLG